MHATFSWLRGGPARHCMGRYGRPFGFGAALGQRRSRAARLSQRPQARRGRSATGDSRVARGEASPRLRDHQGARGTLGRLLQPESRHDLPRSHVSRRVGLREGRSRGCEEVVSHHRRGPRQARRAACVRRGDVRCSCAGSRGACKAFAASFGGTRAARGVVDEQSSDEPTQWRDELNDARRSLRAALYSKFDADDDEQSRVAEILRRATAQILQPKR